MNSNHGSSKTEYTQVDNPFTEVDKKSGSDPGSDQQEVFELVECPVVESVPARDDTL